MILAIIQARLTSTRLPNKIYEKINGKRMIDMVLDATIGSKVDGIVVAAPHDLDVKVPVFIGSEDDVLDRYYRCAEKFGADAVVRITADCPLIDRSIIDYAIDYYHKNTYPYVIFAPVDGLDVEVFSMDILKEAWESTSDKSDREHVTPYMKRKTKISVDTREDLERVIYELA